MATEPLIIRRYEPDPERCVRALARLLGLSLPPAVGAMVPVAQIAPIGVVLPGVTQSISARRRRATAAALARPRAVKQGAQNVPKGTGAAVHETAFLMHQNVLTSNGASTRVQEITLPPRARTGRSRATSDPPPDSAAPSPPSLSEGALVAATTAVDMTTADHLSGGLEASSYV